MNVNSADIETLTSIPEIDEKLAEAIAEYRNVEGMSKTLLEEITPLLQI
ncbi:helix-hairpin-helix domain-containing protein [Desulforhopalus vacuolatus]|nr:helix-hairpin-helix domain-containing protein [Desulforhopalus vacuolatus]